MSAESKPLNVKPLEEETFSCLLNLHIRLSIWAKAILHGPEKSKALFFQLCKRNGAQQAKPKVSITYTKNSQGKTKGISSMTQMIFRSESIQI